MKLTLSHGAAHATPHVATTTAHTIRVRSAMGFGAEAFDGQPLKATHWPPGAMEYLPPGTEHAHATRVESDWITVEFDTLEWEKTTMGMEQNVGPVNCDAGVVHEDCAIWLKAAYRHASEPFSATGRTALGIAIADAFLRALRKGPCRRDAALSPALLRSLAVHVDADLDTNLERLSQEAGLSRFYFTSAFRRATGTTPYQYILGRRLSKARQLLRRTSRSVTDIAFECGFSSHAHLTATFSRHLGVTPTTYREAMSRSDSVVLS